MADSAPSLRALAIGHLRHALSQGSEHSHSHSHAGLAFDTENADAEGMPPISSGISQLVAGITNGIASVLGSSEQPPSAPAPSAFSAALLGEDSSSRLDPEFQGLLWTIALDLVFFSLCFFAYTLMTKESPKSSAAERRSLLASDRSINEPESVEPRHPVLADGEEGQATPLPPAKLLDRLFAPPSLPSNNGNLYLRFLQLALVLALSAGVLMMPVLLGLYITGGNKDGDPTWLQQASAGNLPLRSRALVVPFLYSLGFAAAAAVVLAYLRRDVLWTLPWTRASNASGKSELSETLGSVVADRVARTVHLQGLSWRLVDETQLRRFIEAQLQAPDCVEEAHIVRDTQTLREVVAARRTVANGIDRATIIEARTGHPAGPDRCCECCCCCCKPGDPVLPDLLTERAKLERAELEARKEKPLGTGHAFLVFRGPNPPPLSRLNRIAGTYGSGPMNTEDWSFSMAPPPGDIIWDNLHVTSGQQWARIVLINLALFILMVLIIAPVAVLQYIEPLLARVQDGLNRYNATTASVLLTKYAPTTVVFLINSLLLPWLIDISVDLERYHLFSQRATAVFRKNLFFMFLNSIAIPSLALNSIYSFLQLSYSSRWKDWRETIGFTFLSSSGYFFLQYAIHAALLGAGAQLIDLPQRIWRWWKLRRAVTPREIATANEVWEFDFGYWWAYRVTLFGVMALYAVIAPLVVPFTALFFFLTLVVDKHTLQQGFYSLRLHGVQLAGSAARFSWGYVVLLLLVMSAFFAVQGDWCFVPAGLLFVSALVLLSLLWCSPVMDIPTEPPEETHPPAPGTKEELDAKLPAPADSAAVSMEEARAPAAPSDGITDLNHDDWWEDGQRPPTGALMRQVPLSDLYTHPLLRAGGLGQPGMDRQDRA